MIGSHNDKGARCPKHAGHAFLPRCYACESLNVEFSTLHIESDNDAA